MSMRSITRLYGDLKQVGTLPFRTNKALNLIISNSTSSNESINVNSITHEFHNKVRELFIANQVIFLGACLTALNDFYDSDKTPKFDKLSRNFCLNSIGLCIDYDTKEKAFLRLNNSEDKEELSLKRSLYKFKYFLNHLSLHLKMSINSEAMKILNFIHQIVSGTILYFKDNKLPSEQSQLLDSVTQHLTEEYLKAFEESFKPSSDSPNANVTPFLASNIQSSMDFAIIFLEKVLNSQNLKKYHHRSLNLVKTLLEYLKEKNESTRNLNETEINKFIQRLNSLIENT
jgi:hypothetical protein